LDELPQLFNVLRGEMSLVGPRPDLRKYLDRLSADLMPILQLTPGITSPASILFRDEEKLLGTLPASELEQYYVSKLLPQKVQLDVSYFREANWRSDIINVLVQTGATVLFRHAKNKRQNQHTSPDSL
jgi:lipopolysaccharide/colanic/teichoic acid biosynthesis glycosyltransferase